MVLTSFDNNIEKIAKQLTRQIDEEQFGKKYAPVKEILILAGTGAFLALAVAMPNLPQILKPLLSDNYENESKAWKRFNIPYLKRTLNRLESQKLVEITEDNGVQTVKITRAGHNKILKYAIEKIIIKKPGYWDGKWYLVSYDVPRELKVAGDIFRKYLCDWKFYPIHESVLLHAYPCVQQVEFLRQYLNLGEFVRIFTVSNIENDQVFKEFFGV